MCVFFLSFTPHLFLLFVCREKIGKRNKVWFWILLFSLIVWTRFSFQRFLIYGSIKLTFSFCESRGAKKEKRKIWKIYFIFFSFSQVFSAIKQGQRISLSLSEWYLGVRIMVWFHFWILEVGSYWNVRWPHWRIRKSGICAAHYLHNWNLGLGFQGSGSFVIGWMEFFIIHPKSQAFVLVASQKAYVFLN